MGVSDSLTDAERALDDARSLIDAPLPALEVAHVPPSDTDGSYIVPWHQQPEESQLLYSYFVHYRDSGPSRTVRATAEYFNKSYTYFTNNISGQYRWVARAAAYDRREEELYQVRKQQAIREMADRHAAQIVQSLRAAGVVFDVLAEGVESGELHDEIRAMSAKEKLSLANRTARVVPVLMAAERLARGMPTEIREVSGEIEHKVSYVQPDQLGDIVDILAAAGELPRLGGSGEADSVDDAEVIEVHSVDATDSEPEAGRFPSHEET